MYYLRIRLRTLCTRTIILSFTYTHGDTHIPTRTHVSEKGNYLYMDKGGFDLHVLIEVH